LVYGHHVILPWEMQSDSRRVVLQKDLSSKDYSGLMMDELEDLHMIRLRALENIEKNKLRVAKYYNKNVKVRCNTLKFSNFRMLLGRIIKQQFSHDFKI
jgi:hypothetical protein